MFTDFFFLDVVGVTDLRKTSENLKLQEAEKLLRAEEVRTNSH